MRLMVLSGFWPTTENSISGVFVVQQVAALACLDIEVTVVVARTIGKSSAPYLTVSELGLDVKKIEVFELPVARLPEKLSSLRGGVLINVELSKWFYGRGIRRLVGEHGPFSGCIVHGGRPMGLSIPFWRDCIDGRVAMVIHGADPFLSIPYNAARLRNYFSKASMAADVVVLVGKSLTLHALSIGIPEVRLLVIANGSAVPSHESVYLRKRLTTNFVRIVSVSNLIALKGIGYNLRALAAIEKRRPDLTWEYRVVGDGPESSRLKMIAKTLGIEAKVRFLGRLAYDETMTEISDADIFSLPSWGEAFGIVYLEAMSRMRPVIGCLENGAADIVTHGVNGLLVPPHDIEALAIALEELMSSPEMCCAIGRESRILAEGYTWEHNADKLLAAIGIESKTIG